ncbi:substrate-binding domain-containing protein [Saccharicrinis sp. GN24d3]|uniref:substrate-binding domain-containing protein n=1 Tax=Saccharicrinis sp. GN24d3 TaxID=3458416 RepID=UPI004034FA0C
MKIRIIDIAKKAGVSAGTVDRVIHQRGRYSEKSKVKVEKAIQDLGYAPDIMARNLALKKELHIVCLIPNPSDTKYWERPFAGIESAMTELASFKVKIETILYLPRKENFKTACDQVLQLNPDGVVYVPMFFEESSRFAKLLHNNSIPFVHINIQHSEINPLSFVGQDPIAAGRTAASLCHLALKKNNNILIAYISKETQEYSHLHDRINGFMEYFENIKFNPSLIYHLDIKISNDESEYDKQLIHFLQNKGNIQIIYVPNSRAYKIASILKKHHRKDIVVIGFDTLRENICYMHEGYINIIIGQQSKSQGFNAVMLLFNSLFRKEKTNPLNLLPVNILNAENIDFYEGLMS